MLVRIRSKDGNFRFELQPNDDGTILVSKILETTINADPTSVTISNKPRGGEVPVTAMKGRSLATLGIKHGDMIFVGYKSKEVPAVVEPIVTNPPIPAGATAGESSTKRPWQLVKEDPVDSYWRQRDGKIPRKRDSQFCKHGPNAMCDYCMPLEPYDTAYHASHNIKHLSFHSYLRKLQPSPSPNALPPLDPLSYRVKVPCPSGSHLPYPGGICTKCQPSAITLQRQGFRMVDHLEFASPQLIETFLHAWRATGDQRFGWMLGRYAPYDEVPMGIKAVVEAIHEPPQEGEVDGLSLEVPWDDEPRVRALAAEAGLNVVGYIFTDLTPQEEDRTKSVCKRHAGSFFLSSQETLFAAHLQNAQPTPSKSSSSGYYSSRLVTAVLSGTPDGGIDVQAYMASEQACAMVDAEMVEPSVDPGVVRVREPEDGDGRYVPDVFFRYRNEYGLEVKESARPCFPVEYLLVNLTHGFPTAPSPMFLSSAFPVENRPFIQLQDISALFSTLIRLKAPELIPSQAGGQKATEVVTYLSDWHLLAFLPTTGLLGEDDIKVLLKAVVSPDFNNLARFDAVLQTDGWQTLIAIAQESIPSRGMAQSAARPPPVNDGFEAIPPELLNEVNSGGAGEGGVGKVCPHCTYANASGAVDCEVCGLPL